MKLLTVGIVMLLAIGMGALAADMAPPGRDRPLIQVSVAQARVDVAAPVACVETEVAEVARSGSSEVRDAARVIGWSELRSDAQGGALCHEKRWRAWNAG